MSKEQKQFSLDSKDKCIIYLNRIISSFELCSDKFKRYIKEHEKLLNEYKGSEKISYNVYSDMVAKTYNVMSYIDNLLGDSQGSSISYFKYRKLISKKIKKDEGFIPVLEENEEIRELLSNFNRERNWQNHIPESLLVAEMEEVENGSMVLPLSPVVIRHYNYVTYDYFEDLLISNIAFLKNARKVIQFAKKEYSLLVGDSVTYPREYTDIPLGFEKSIPAQKSAQIQGLKKWN